MLGVAAHNILRDWTTYVTAVGVAVATWGGVWVRVVRPGRVAHAQHEAERARLRQENAELNDRLKTLPERVGMLEWWAAVHEKAP